MKKIFFGIIFCLFFQFFLVIAILFYKGEKSYATYYYIISSYPNVITQGYLKNAIYNKSVDDSLELVRRQSRLIYSNTKGSTSSVSNDKTFSLVSKVSSSL